MTDTIEYVIYVRKSTDDASWERQAQSIPDQIERCVTYAKEHGLVLKMKPDNFEFEDEKELRLEDNEKLICIGVQVCVHVCLYTYTPWQRLENNEKNDIIEKNFNVQ